MVSFHVRKANTHPLHAVVKAYDAFRRWPIIPVAVILILLLSAIFAPIVAPYDPLDGNLRARNVPPVWIEEGSSEYLLGTDHIGRDILSRTIHGGRVSFQVAAAVLLAGAGVGTVVGLASGYLGGVVDEVFMRLADFRLRDALHRDRAGGVRRVGPKPVAGDNSVVYLHVAAFCAGRFARKLFN